MDYKELIEQLRDIVAHGDERPAEYCTNRCGGCDACDRAADAIETLLADRQAAGWISIEDRLPEYGVELLMFFSKYGVMSVGSMDDKEHWTCNLGIQ